MSTLLFIHEGNLFEFALRSISERSLFHHFLSLEGFLLEYEGFILFALNTKNMVIE
ncbi:hypothetical protein AHAS_Ahas11G0083500 [Arachis hypogaea]